MVEERPEHHGGFRRIPGRELAFEDAQFAGRPEGNGLQRIARKLREGVESPQGIQLVAEELESDGPGRGGRPDIENAAAEGEGPLLGHLGFRFVSLFLQPLDQVEGIGPVSASEAPKAADQVARGEGALQQRGDVGDHEGSGGGPRLVPAGQGSQGRQAIGNDVDVREPGLVGEHLPVGEKQGGAFGIAASEPGLKVLQGEFLGLQAGEDEHHGAVGSGLAQNGGQESMGGIARRGERATALRLQSREQGVRRGSSG